MGRYLSVDWPEQRRRFFYAMKTGELEAACTLGAPLYGERNRLSVSIKRRYFADLLSGGNRTK